MIKYDEENQEFICPFCGGFLDLYTGGDIIIEAYTCEECGRELDSNGDEIEEEWEDYLIERD